MGPISPDLMIQRKAGNAASRYAFQEHGEEIAEDWHAQPTAPGAIAAPAQAAELYRASPVIGRILCLGCRQGDTFFPLMGATGQLAQTGQQFNTGLMGPAGSYHLYSGGHEISQSVYDGLPVYELPAPQSQYRLTLDASLGSEKTHTAWDFLSSAPTSGDQVPGEYVCLGTALNGSTEPCQADPLVFLRYGAGVDLANAVTAHSGHKLTVTAYHEDPNAPRVTNLRLWTSTDGGVAWHKAKLVHRNRRTGEFTLRYRVPRLDNTDGAVSIKAQARDAAGNTVSQTIIDAFNLTARN